MLCKMEKFRISINVQILLVISSVVQSQNLELIITNTTLPTPRAWMPIVYDQNDTIYIFGGREGFSGSGQYSTQILAYSLNTESLRVVGDSWNRAGGEALLINSQVYHFGGRMLPNETMSDEILGFELGNLDSAQLLAQLPNVTDYPSIVWDDEESIYIFGGTTSPFVHMDSIIRYNKLINSVGVVGRLPRAIVGFSTVWDQNAKVVYILGGLFDGYRINDILRYDPSTGDVVKLAVTLPIEMGYNEAIWTGSEAYVIGGTASVTNPPSVSRFNPSTGETQAYYVDNFRNPIFGHACVYIQKLNRIYIIGGQIGDSWVNQISYIQLE